MVVERQPYIFRFKCTTCGAERDQKISRPKAYRIGCPCGGDAIKVGTEEVPAADVREGRYMNGKPYMQERSYKYLMRRPARRSLISIARSWLRLE